MGLAGYLRLYGKDTMVRFITLEYLKMENVMIAYNKKQHKSSTITLDSTVGFTAVFDGSDYGLRHVASFKGNGLIKSPVKNLFDLIARFCFCLQYSSYTLR